MSLEGRVAIVTGAAGGAGRAVVAALAGEGVRFGLVGSRAERLGALAAELGLDAAQWSAHGAHLRDAAAARAAVEAIVARFGQVDILVHLVGGWTGGTGIVDSADEPFTSMLDQHLWTTLNVVRAVTPLMTAAGWGRIVAVSSPVATDTPARMAAYAIGKAAEEALLGTLAREVAGTGVTVNLLRVRSIDVGEQGDGISTGAGRKGTTPSEIAAAVLYLCSAEAGAVNGARLPLFGAR